MNDSRLTIPIDSTGAKETQTSECVICLETIHPEDDTNLKCCKAQIHRHCYLQCINKYGTCPWCRQTVTVSKLFFLGFDRCADVSVFDRYSSDILVTVKLEIHEDMGPWNNLDQFLTIAKRKKVHLKQMMASDIVIVKLDHPELDHIMLRHAIDNNKVIILVENRLSIPKRRHHKYYKQAQTQAMSLDESLFNTADQMKEFYSSKKDYVETLVSRRIRSGCLLYRLKRFFGF